MTDAVNTATILNIANHLVETVDEYENIPDVDKIAALKTAANLLENILQGKALGLVITNLLKQ